ncbi:MAG: hypothetical protein MI976_19785 [Pseudomonadales bacterium]|nr:hypothetical protein [Pseudomonadales bacterium]
MLNENKNTKNRSFVNRIFKPVEVAYKLHALATVATLAISGVIYGLGFLASNEVDIKPELLIAIIAILLSLYIALVFFLFDLRRRYKSQNIELKRLLECEEERSRSHQERLDFYSRMEVQFATMALLNQNYNRKMIELIYKDFDPRSGQMTERLDRLIDITQQNIEWLVEHMSEVYHTICNAPCGVTIKHVLMDQKEPPEKWKIQTELRDRKSAIRSNRSHGSSGDNTVGLNSDTEYLFIAREGDLYVQDDLTTLSNYKNHNVRWNEFYNATLVLRVDVNLPNKINNIYRLPILCIDNKHGGLDNSTAINYAKEFGYRLAVLHELQQQLIYDRARRNRGVIQIAVG